MTVFDDAIDRGASWLCDGVRHEDWNGTAVAGWGWIPEIPISALNTAEVVCALSAARRPIPDADLVAACLEVGATKCIESGEMSTLHASWLLMAFHRFPGYDDPPPGLLPKLRNHLVGRAIGDGAWAISAGGEEESTFCTALAIEALATCESRNGEADAALEAGIGNLARYLEVGERTVVDTAFAVRALSLETTRELCGSYENLMADQAAAWLQERMRDDIDGMAEEQFQSEKGRQVWRHAILAPAIDAVALREPDAIFTPPMRRSLRTLLERLQVRDPRLSDYGAFRTSADGIVATYSTTLALGALTTIARRLPSRVSAAEVFERLCATDGLDPSDPQEIVALRGRSLTANFPFAFAAAAIVVVQSSVLIALAIADTQMPKGVSRGLIAFGLVTVFAAAVAATAARYPAVSRTRVLAPAFAVATGAAFPILAFVLD